MKTIIANFAVVLIAASACHAAEPDKVVQFEKISAYHHIQVYDENQVRTLSFNGSWETMMSLTNPLTGHFEYTEYFQMPWLWNHDIKKVLMAGLGGGSTQRAYAHYYTNVMVDTVEIDPVVVDVAKKYFNIAEKSNSVIHIEDARVYLRRTTNKYDVILMDAYSTTRYGSSLPSHLTTKEFFQIASDHLSTNGVLAYNVIGQIRGFRSTVIGALYKTLNEVFPQVYMFPAVESQNVVMIGTKSKEVFDAVRLKTEADSLIKSNIVTLPTYRKRLDSFTHDKPDAINRSPVLTDNYAPIESLLNGDR